MTISERPTTSTDTPFEVVVEELAPGDARVQVAGPGQNGARLVQSFRVNVREHSLVRAFHNQVADAFGTRRPRTAIPFHPDGPNKFSICLIDHNLDPRIRYGYGDPCLLRDINELGAELFYLVVTSNDAPDKFPILTSPDLLHWRLCGFVFDAKSKPEWAADGENCSDYWAPELHRVGSGYLLCFAARGIDGSMSIGLAQSENPTGPFKNCTQPVVTGNVIDPHIFVDGDAVYLFWKVDNNDRWPIKLVRLLARDPELTAALFPEETDRRTAFLTCALLTWIESRPAMERFLLLQPLISIVTAHYRNVRSALGALGAERVGQHASDISDVLAMMITPVLAQRLDPLEMTLMGEPQVVLRNDEPWEAHLVEGLWITYEGGRYYACYSGNDFSTSDYGIGVAVADSPLGPFRKMSRPFLQSTEQWVGPGHPSVIAGPDRAPIMFLHAYRAGQTGYKAFRALLALPVALTPDGMVRRAEAWCMDPPVALETGPT